MNVQNKLKKVELLELNVGGNRILYWFFSYPGVPITLSELAKEAKVSKQTATIVVNSLLREGFLNKEEIGRSWRLSVNPNHSLNFTKKVAFNLEMIYNSGIIEAVHKSINQQVRAVVLFGSYRKGDDTEKSDIDLAVEVIGKNIFDVVNLGVLPEFGFRKNVSVNLHIFSRDAIDNNLFSNIANGIVLQGYLEVSK
jgi:predicted nucleotidyltransferase/predicted DNA-binding transcriptional regulator